MAVKQYKTHHVSILVDEMVVEQHYDRYGTSSASRQQEHESVVCVLEAIDRRLAIGALHVAVDALELVAFQLTIRHNKYKPLPYEES